uniref:Uncharacterized protein n=1 Tax=Anguilla anguilla TaxID=7936 RepID=A0A0E9TMF6_ANGAN
MSLAHNYPTTCYHFDSKVPRLGQLRVRHDRYCS